MNNLIYLNINNVFFYATKGKTIFQACFDLGHEIPRFCYHESLLIAGNCRMCLVEVVGSPKLVASCAMPILNNMRILTDTNRVRLARESVLEYLLANHPLDCPVCDQGGECDLQDITVSFGWDKGRFYEYSKRAVEDKDLGPLIKTVMTRCIHCTRCVRFSQEVFGLNYLITSGRGVHTEIGLYKDNFLLGELSGNVIDLCPVGALTSKPYAFLNRSWELNYTDSIDVLDSLGSNIRVDAYLNKVVRVLPRYNSELNEYWITDKTRFSYDFLYNQRLQFPWFKVKNSNLSKTSFISLGWEASLYIFLNKIINSDHLSINAGDFTDMLSFISLKDFFTSIGFSNFSFSYFNLNKSADFGFSYLLNTALENLNYTTIYFILNTNLRLELPLLSFRVRKSFLNNNYLKLYSFGLANSYLTFPVKDFGSNLINLLDFFEGRSRVSYRLKNFTLFPINFFDNSILDNTKITVLTNHNLLAGLNSNFFNYHLSLLTKRLNIVRNNWIGLNFISSSTSTLSLLEVGFLPGVNSFNSFFDKFFFKDDSYFFYNINYEDPFLFDVFSKTSNNFFVYQGHHPNFNVLHADLILPSCTYLEKYSLYLNLLGNVQQANKVVNPTKYAKSDWEISKALFFFKNTVLKGNFSILNDFYGVLTFFSYYIKYKKFTDNYTEFNLKQFNRLFDFSSVSAKINNIINDMDGFFTWLHFSRMGSFFYTNTLLNQEVLNYYKSDNISKFSKTLNLSSRKFLNVRFFFNNN